MESAEEEDNDNIYVHLIRFLIRSDELLNPNYGRSTIGAQRPIIVPSLLLFMSIVWPHAQSLPCSIGDSLRLEGSLRESGVSKCAITLLCISVGIGSSPITAYCMTISSQQRDRYVMVCVKTCHAVSRTVATSTYSRTKGSLNTVRFKRGNGLRRTWYI